jgi:hypothetical protein
MLAPDVTSAYITSRSLRQAGFPELAINRALNVLFPLPKEADEFGEPPASEPEPYEPTAEDWQDFALWSLESDRRREFEDAMSQADALEAHEDADRFNERDLAAAGLPIG